MAEQDSMNLDGSPEWETLSEMIERRNPDGLQDFVAAIPSGDVPRVLSRLSADELTRLLQMLSPHRAALLLEQLPHAQSVAAITLVEPQAAARIIGKLPSNIEADVLAELPSGIAQEILRTMDPDEADEIRRLSSFPEHTAGGVMITEYLAFPEHARIKDVLADLRANTEAYSRHDIQYIYITDKIGRLEGVLRLRDLILADGNLPVSSIMIANAHAVSVDSSLEELQDFFAARPYRGVPVVGPRNRLLGVVRHADVAEAREEQAASDHLKSQGIVGGEELRTMPVAARAWRRLSWLSVNIFLNILAASVIALYQDTLSAVIVLAVFLPIISDMSGCSGNQAIAVSMRELTLGVIQPADIWRVWGKELSVGAINACVLGLLLGIAAYMWKGNAVLSIVVGTALAVNTVVAVSLGGLVPLLLRRIGKDPALASGPILTTVTDMCGFFLVLSLASMALSALN